VFGRKEVIVWFPITEIPLLRLQLIKNKNYSKGKFTAVGNQLSAKS